MVCEWSRFPIQQIFYGICRFSLPLMIKFQG
jgi:hypothetical protein